MEEEKILQIMPADGWKARYEQDGGDTFERPLVGWALVEDDDYRFVVGLDAADYVEPCEDVSNFLFYVPPE